jgi:hypothetical protein
MEKRRTRGAVRRPNALKHGAFSASELLPGEDPREFECLMNAVFAEWRPSGAVEEDAARSLASAIWRKQRLSIFLRAQRARARYGKTFAGSQEPSRTRIKLIAELQVLVNTFREKHEQGKIEETCGKLIDETSEKLIKDIDVACATPEANRAASAVKYSVPSDKEREEALVDVELAALGESISPEQFVKQMDLEQRLDAKIDRAIKRLLQLKAMKSIVGLGPPSQTDGTRRALPPQTVIGGKAGSPATTNFS